MKRMFAKRFLAIAGIVMCLMCSVMPVAFAATVTCARSNVRIAGFEHGLSTLAPSATYSSNFYGGVVLFEGIEYKSANVSDVVWVQDGSASGYFTVVYTIMIEPVATADMIDKPIVAIPLDWGDGNVRYEWFLSPDMNMRMENATSDMRMHGLGPGTGYYHTDGTGCTMMSFYVSGYEESETISEIKIGLRVWDSDVVLITSAALDNTGINGWLEYPFKLVTASDGIILYFFNTMMNAPLFAPIIAISACLLLMSIVISVVR